ncbi:MAG: hypothetical protein LIO54_07155 [Oscillospiraceae bacterium]|nr:hypothetical protein [Oscillospiraceae bacterium]
MEMITSAKEHMALLSQEQLAQVAFGTLCQAFAMRLMEHAGYEDGLYQQVALEFLEEEQEQTLSAQVQNVFHIDLRLVLESLQREADENKREKKTAEKVLTQVLQLQQQNAGTSTPQTSRIEQRLLSMEYPTSIWQQTIYAQALLQNSAERVSLSRNQVMPFKSDGQNQRANTQRAGTAANGLTEQMRAIRMQMPTQAMLVWRRAHARGESTFKPELPVRQRILNTARFPQAGTLQGLDKSAQDVAVEIPGSVWGSSAEQQTYTSPETRVYRVEQEAEHHTNQRLAQLLTDVVERTVQTYPFKAARDSHSVMEPEENAVKLGRAAARQEKGQTELPTPDVQKSKQAGDRLRNDANRLNAGKQEDAPPEQQNIGEQTARDEFHREAEKTDIPSRQLQAENAANATEQRGEAADRRGIPIAKQKLSNARNVAEVSAERMQPDQFLPEPLEFLESDAEPVAGMDGNRDSGSLVSRKQTENKATSRITGQGTASAEGDANEKKGGTARLPADDKRTRHGPQSSLVQPPDAAIHAVAGEKSHAGLEYVNETSIQLGQEHETQPSAETLMHLTVPAQIKTRIDGKEPLQPTENRLAAQPEGVFKSARGIAQPPEQQNIGEQTARDEFAPKTEKTDIPSRQLQTEDVANATEQQGKSAGRRGIPIAKQKLSNAQNMALEVSAERMQPDQFAPEPLEFLEPNTEPETGIDKNRGSASLVSRKQTENEAASRITGQGTALAEDDANEKKGGTARLSADDKRTRRNPQSSLAQPPDAAIHAVAGEKSRAGLKYVNKTSIQLGQEQETQPSAETLMHLTVPAQIKTRIDGKKQMQPTENRLAAQPEGVFKSARGITQPPEQQNIGEQTARDEFHPEVEKTVIPSRQLQAEDVANATEQQGKSADRRGIPIAKQKLSNAQNMALEVSAERMQPDQFSPEPLEFLEPDTEPETGIDKNRGSGSLVSRKQTENEAASQMTGQSVVSAEGNVNEKKFESAQEKQTFPFPVDGMQLGGALTERVREIRTIPLQPTENRLAAQPEGVVEPVDEPDAPLTYRVATQKDTVAPSDIERKTINNCLPFALRQIIAASLNPMEQPLTSIGQNMPQTQTATNQKKIIKTMSGRPTCLETYTPRLEMRMHRTNEPAYGMSETELDTVGRENTLIQWSGPAGRKSGMARDGAGSRSVLREKDIAIFTKMSGNHSPGMQMNGMRSAVQEKGKNRIYMEPAQTEIPPMQPRTTRTDGIQKDSFMTAVTAARELQTTATAPGQEHFPSQLAQAEKAAKALLDPRADGDDSVPSRAVQQGETNRLAPTGYAVSLSNGWHSTILPQHPATSTSQQEARSIQARRSNTERLAQYSAETKAHGVQMHGSNAAGRMEWPQMLYHASSAQDVARSLQTARRNLGKKNIPRGVSGKMIPFGNEGSFVGQTESEMQDAASISVPQQNPLTYAFPQGGIVDREKPAAFVSDGTNTALSRNAQVQARSWERRDNGAIWPEQVELSYLPGQQIKEQVQQGTQVSAASMDSEYVRSLPTWAQNFLKGNAAGTEQTVTGAAMGVARDISALPGAACGQEQIAWTAPQVNHRPAEITYQKKEAPQASAAPPARMSDSELRHTADKVYQMIEERIRRERRRLGL